LYVIIKRIKKNLLKGKTKLKKILSMLICLICLIILFSSCEIDKIETISQNSKNSSVITKPVTTSSTISTNITTSISMSFAGDCTFGTVNGNDKIGFVPIFVKSDNPIYPFDKVIKYFKADDLTVINFEGTLTTATKEADKQWHFKGLKTYANILPESSVEVAVLSNNHAPIDYFQQGFDDTKTAMVDAGVGIIYQDTPYIKTIKGVQIIIIGDSSIIGENTTFTTGVEERVTNQIKRYKKINNIVIVDMHWGCELALKPSDWQVNTAHKFIDEGADLIVGQHPHIVQGIELYKGKYIAYSLGNFSFGGSYHTMEPQTFILSANFNVSNQGCISSIEIVPCYSTSSIQKSSANVLMNNYQPIPLVGKEANYVKNTVLQRSSVLQGGITDISLKQ
jgi:poly-gamma-glutamate capsule biosynthesis protein CapA/YwtB (metallophosphatase superfamily)